MRKFGGLLILSFWANHIWAQVEQPEANSKGSSTGYLIIGAILLIIVIIILFNRQKRKFNH